MITAANFVEHFWSRVRKGAGCWLWVGSNQSAGGSGYGRLRIDRRWRYAHRLSWEMHNGPIPAGLAVLHRCDDSLCVNPDHLFLGTQAENMRDCMAKGRSGLWRGQNGDRKLTHAQRTEIVLRHAHGESQSALARAFGVQQGAVATVLRYSRPSPEVVQ
jgi:hypothetical protein